MGSALHGKGFERGKGCALARNAIDEHIQIIDGGGLKVREGNERRKIVRGARVLRGRRDCIAQIGGAPVANRNVGVPTCARKDLGEGIRDGSYKRSVREDDRSGGGCRRDDCRRGGGRLELRAEGSRRHPVD